MVFLLDEDESPVPSPAASREHEPPVPSLAASCSVPSLAVSRSRNLLNEQLLVHLLRAEPTQPQALRAEKPQTLHEKGATGSRISNTQLPLIVNGLMQAQRANFLERHVTRDDSKERLLERNFGGRSLSRLVQHAKSLSSLHDAEHPQQGESGGRESATVVLAAAVLAPPAVSYVGVAGLLAWRGFSQQDVSGGRRKKIPRLQTIEGLQTGPELRSKARDFLASSDTLLARREQGTVGKSFGEQSPISLGGGRDREPSAQAPFSPPLGAATRGQHEMMFE